MHILIVTPQFPYPPTGACEQDRLVGIKLLQEMGHTVSVLSKVSAIHMERAEEGAKQLGLRRYALIPYQESKPLLPRLLDPRYLDGAAYEYVDPVLQEKLNEMLPDVDLVWCEYTYLWPVYRAIRRHKKPIMLRAINIEPLHFLEEDGMSFINYLKYRIKWISEKLSVLGADHVGAITPQEEEIYAKLGVKSHNTIPLRALHTFIGTHRVKKKDVLDVVFMGSTYRVNHNKEAARKVIEEIAPLLEKEAPGIFKIHIVGAKLPKELQKVLPPSVVYEGYVDDLNAFLEHTDIALVPSLFGQGMQQKIFEPIVRGIPTITNKRAIAGYDLADEIEYVHAESTEQYVDALVSLQDSEVRRGFSKRAVAKSRILFSEERIKEVIAHAIDTAYENNHSKNN